MRDRRHERGIRGFIRARSGTAGVEFAFVMPILLLLMFGSIEIGRGLHDYHVISESVRDAARYLSRVRVTCPAGTFVDPNDVTKAQALAMTGSADGLAPNLLGYWDYQTNAADVVVSQPVPCIDNSGGEFAGPLYGPWVPKIELTANVPFTFLFGELVAPNASITIEISHTVIGVGL